MQQGGGHLRQGIVDLIAHSRLIVAGQAPMANMANYAHDENRAGSTDGGNPDAPANRVFRAEGTPSQHSFHQLLHQGTQVVPCDFIDLGLDRNLSANAHAQADALAFGTDDPKLAPHRQYPGNRPSSMFTLRGLNPGNLGRLIALYEHKVFVQGVIWNINSFDQWGVELGKELAGKLLAT